jgi:DNA-binding transcriptional regulator YiaG
MTKHLNISYSALRAWIDGRSQSISQGILERLEKFEKKIPALRQEAEVRFAEIAEKEDRRKSRLAKPWAVARIRSFMHTWGMSQVEFALFAGVSYDSVTSWSRGRRRLVRRETAQHLTFAEKIATDRGFDKKKSGEKENPWVAIRHFANQGKTGQFLTEIPKNGLGTFIVQVVEKNPGDMRFGKKNETLTIVSLRKKGQVEVKLTLGQKEWTFAGEFRSLGGVRAIELQTSPDDPLFMNGRVGCITPAKNQLRLSLWAMKDLPIRMSAVAQ